MAREYPNWKIELWRAVRTAVAVAIAQTFVLRPDWANPRESISNIVVVFLSAFFIGLGKFIRDKWGAEEKGSGLVHKIPV